MITAHQFLSALLRTRIRSERGASLVEYALLIALISIVCIAAVTTLGERTGGAFSSAAGGF